MILYENKFKELKRLVDNCIHKFSSILLFGDYGKGKSTLIQHVIEMADRPYMSVCQYPGMTTPYEALYSSLSQRLEEENYDIGSINNEISHREFIKQLFITICRQTPDIVVIFQDVRDFDNILVELIRECIQYFKIHKVACCIIMEFSTDNLCPKNEDCLFICKDICVDSISLDSNQCLDYREYFSSLLKGKNRIKTEQMDCIISEAFFNPALIKKMVRYFIDVGIFYEQDNCWFSDEPDFHLTAKLFEEHISHRYEKLDEVLKTTLNKASIIGYEIDTRLLSQPLGIIKAEDNLRRIERLSRLITHTENAYQFENNTVYNIVNGKMSASEKNALHHLVADYLYGKIPEYRKGEPTKILRILYIIKRHYLEAENLEAAIHASGCYIHQAFTERNYDAVLSGIKEYVDLSSGRYPLAEQQILCLGVHAYMILGNFTKACICLEKIQRQYLPDGQIYWLDYLKAYCLFNSGKGNEAKEIAEYLVGKLDSKCLKDTFLLLKLDIFLAGMYHHFGDIRNSLRRYEQGLSIAEGNLSYCREYNHLLSISNMFLTNELAIPKIEMSMVYFKENHLMTSYAKSANNVAINYLYEGDFETAARYLEESRKIFDDICSSSIHYPLNNLGTAYAHMQNYSKALELFEHAREYQTEPFSVMWISMNIANCLRKLGDFDKSERILQEVENSILSSPENTFLLKRNLFISKGLLALDREFFSNARSCCEQALEIEIHMLHNDTYPVFISKLLKNICEAADLSLPKSAIPYSDSFSDCFCQNLLDNHTHWGNFLFWEA